MIQFCVRWRIVIFSFLDRHLNESKCHKIALQKERDLGENERTVQNIAAGPSQPRIDSLITKASGVAHRILVKTAYELALTPTMPLTHFAVIVKVLREAKVQLIDGTIS